MVTVTPLCPCTLRHRMTLISKIDAVYQIMAYYLNMFHLERLFPCTFCGCQQQLFLEIYSQKLRT